MKKKLIIASSFLVVLIALIITLSFTVFSLKTVEIDYRTSRTALMQVEDDDIISAGEFKLGSPVLFHSKKEYKEKIEGLNPYIKVINIETVFPDKFVVHICERQEVYAVEYDGGHYICDEDLRVLKVDEEYTSNNSNPILLNFENEFDKTYQAGDYIEEENPEIYHSLFSLNRPLAQQQELIESISLSSQHDDNINQDVKVAAVKFFSGQTVKIVNYVYGLDAKVKMMMDVYTQLFNFKDKEITLKDGSEHTLTIDDLQTCTIYINNYYDYSQYDEKDCYFDIII